MRRSYCYPTLLDADGSFQTYSIVGDGRKNIRYTVSFDESSYKLWCVSVLPIQVQRNCVYAATCHCHLEECQNCPIEVLPRLVEKGYEEKGHMYHCVFL